MSPDQCAKEVLDVVPAVMRFIRAELRSHRAPGLSVPQFRALMYIHRSKDTSLNGVSGHLGLTAASTSTLVEGLSRRALLLRSEDRGDRRRITLTLTTEGRKAMEAALHETHKRLASVLDGLAPGELSTVAQAMAFLRPSFSALARE
jgi:DNA-binding MarR family transcriptional regulator